MTTLLRIAGAVLLTAPVAVFCVVGFLLTLEAPADALGSVRLFLGALGITSVFAAGWLIWPKRQRS
jgi:hypothetical protein